jgi:hypothetical protein
VWFTGIVETLIAIGDADRRRIRRRALLVHDEEDRERPMTTNVGKAFIAEIERQLGQDIPIWEHKVMKMRPMLCDGDGPIGLFRRWCKQFYLPEAGDGQA